MKYTNRGLIIWTKRFKSKNKKKGGKYLTEARKYETESSDDDLTNAPKSNFFALLPHTLPFFFLPPSTSICHRFRLLLSALSLYIRSFILSLHILPFAASQHG